MSKPGLAFGLNLAKKPGASKPAPPKRKPMFGGGDEDSDDDDDSNAAGREGKAEQIGELDDFGMDAPATSAASKAPARSNKGGSGRPLSGPPKLKPKAQSSAMFGDLSSALTSRRNAEAAAQVDASVYEYDSVYDSIKPKKQVSKEDAERKPKYMRNLIQAAEVRKRDALIAEEKKIAREREAEGEEFAGKEKFVTEAYRKQQEENKRLEEEEKRREEEEAKNNKGGGMSAFYRTLLNKDEERHADAVRAAEEKVKQGPTDKDDVDDNKQEQEDNEKSDAQVARELNEKGAAIAVNEDGQIVDKRQLLRGGLNVSAKKKEAAQRENKDRAAAAADRPRRDNPGQQFGRKQAMRERQSRMLEEQLEQSLKRSRETEEAQRQEVERASKSQKTEGDISSAKERYLARKRAAEEEKKKKAAAGEAD